MTIFRRLSLSVLVLLAASVPLQAQTALNSTTLSAAIADNTTQVISLASTTNVSVGDLLFVDREAMLVQTVSPTKVTRGTRGTPATPHVTAALVYTGATSRFFSSIPRPGLTVSGACTRASIRFLPMIALPLGDVFDCPVGTGVWVLLNSPAMLTAKTEWFTIANGAGTTIDDVIIRPTRPIRIIAARIVYAGATTGTVAAGTAQIGTTVAGSDLVAATNYENVKAVGTSTAMVVVSGAVAANTPVIVRHTGTAAGAGSAIVEIDFVYR